MTEKTQYAEIAKSLWLSSANISKQLDNTLGAVHGIGLAEYMVLLNLSEAPNSALRRIDVAEALGRTASGITRMLLPMEKIGLIKKDVHERDARVSLVKMTSSGKRILKDATLTLNKKSEQIFKDINEDQADQLLIMMRLIRV